MTNAQKLLGGTVHSVPKDLQDMLETTPKARETWNSTTPLARNEWICLVISGKKAETRIRRLKRAQDQLSLGQRRPCCWEGCPHRKNDSI